LETDEKLDISLKREIEEEVGDIEVEIAGPINASRISFDYGPLVIIDYLARYKGGDVVLSDEHDEFRWETAEKIEKEKEYAQWLKDITKKAKSIIDLEKSIDGWKRCQADFENYKRRQQELGKELVAYANQNMILDILPVVDNFHASTEHIPSEQKDNAWVTGIMHIQRQLESVLENNNVQEIKINVGDAFDPAVMDAVEQKNGKDGESKNIVSKVLQKGYKLGEKVIRPARVVVE
jgi:molecular chaperone GrpE